MIIYEVEDNVYVEDYEQGKQSRIKIIRGEGNAGSRSNMSAVT